MPLYENYTVIGSKIVVKYVNTSGSIPATVGIALRESTTTATELVEYIEGRWCTHTNLGASPATPEGTLTMKYSPKMIGYGNPLSVDSLKGTASSNPAEGTFYHIFANDMNEENGITINLNVTIEYLVVFTDPIQPGIS
jgi:hypothetical protein